MTPPCTLFPFDTLTFKFVHTLYFCYSAELNALQSDLPLGLHEASCP